MRVISIGEVLWDVLEDKEHLGGAPFNFAAHLKKAWSRCSIRQRRGSRLARRANFGSHEGDGALK
jgi:fructokinase